MKKLTFILIVAIIFGACSNSNKNSETKNTNNDSVAVADTTTTEKQKSLYDLLWNLVESPNFHGTIKEVDYPAHFEEDSEMFGYKILDQKPNDYIKLNLWGFSGQEDTLIFQLLKHDPEYKLYVFYNQGHCENPKSFYNDIYLFKLDKNNVWTEKKLLNNDYDLSYFTTYNPEKKAISDFDEQTDPNTLFGAVPTDLKALFLWFNDDEIFIQQEIQTPQIMPNPVLIKGNIQKGENDKACYIIGEIDEQYHRYYLQKGGKKKITILYTYGGKSYVGDFYSDAYNQFEKEVPENKDTSLRFFIKYKDEGYSKTFEDYEIIGPSPVIASFVRYDMGDFFWYTFKTKLGYFYSFNDVRSKYAFDDDRVNKQYIGKKFKIWFHSEMIDNEYGGGKMEFFTADSLIEIDS